MFPKRFPKFAPRNKSTGISWNLETRYVWRQIWQSSWWVDYRASCWGESTAPLLKAEDHTACPGLQCWSGGWAAALAALLGSSSVWAALSTEAPVLFQLSQAASWWSDNGLWWFASQCWITEPLQPINTSWQSCRALLCWTWKALE